MTPGEAKAIAKTAFIFAVPLVVNYVRMYRETIDPSSPCRSGGFGHWVHRRTTTTTETDRATAHATSLHSSAWVDLRSQPWVFSVPAGEAGRPYIVRTTDLWDFVVHAAPIGDHHGRVLLASSAWMGEVPTGVDRVVRGESDFVRTEIWLRTHEAGDPAQVRSVQQEFVLIPLCALTEKAPPIAAPPIEWWPTRGDVTATDEFWSVANAALGLTLPHSQDRVVLERIAEIGVTAGGPWDPGRFHALELEAIEEGFDDAVTGLMRAAATVGDAAELHRSRADTDRDYYGRALGALRHWPGNRADSG